MMRVPGRPWLGRYEFPAAKASSLFFGFEGANLSMILLYKLDTVQLIYHKCPPNSENRQLGLLLLEIDSRRDSEACCTASMGKNPARAHSSFYGLSGFFLKETPG
jgi:hypothetical protein